MSICVRTIVNHQENKREIVCATVRIWHNSAFERHVFLDIVDLFCHFVVEIDDATPPEKLKCTVNTFVRPLDQFPPNFEKQAKTNGKGTIMPMKNERMLLSSLLGDFLIF